MQLLEEVPGLYIRRLTLEDPKTARKRTNYELQLPANQVRHPHISYMSSKQPTSSYRSWFEQIRQERQAMLTITPLELPDCSVPLVQSQVNKRWMITNRRDNTKGESLTKKIYKINETRIQKVKNLENSKIYKNENCENQKSEIFKGSSSKELTYIHNDKNDESLGCEEFFTRKYTTERNLRCIEDDSAECICSQISEKLRISIRKKTQIDDSSCNLGSEVTHTIRIEMKYNRCGQTSKLLSNNRKKPTLATATNSFSSPCPGVSVALDFTLHCNSVELTSRDIIVKHIGKKIYPGCSMSNSNLSFNRV